MAMRRRFKNAMAPTVMKPRRKENGVRNVLALSHDEVQVWEYSVLPHKADRWNALLAYFCQRLFGEIDLPAKLLTLQGANIVAIFRVNYIRTQVAITLGLEDLDV